MKEKYFSIAGIIVGLISVILSFVVKSQNYSNYEYSSSYGGDAYTGIQNAAASTANNVGYLINAVTWGFFAILFVFGLACIVYFGSKFLVSMEGEAGSEKKNNSGISLFSARLNIPEVKAENKEYVTPEGTPKQEAETVAE